MKNSLKNRWDGKVDFFEYSEKKHDYIPVEELSYGKTDNDRWGVDYIIAYGSDYDHIGDVNYSLKEISEFAKKLADKFNVDINSIRLLSYTWYNGADEPIYFERYKD